MDLFTLTVGLPFAPLKGLLAVARLLQEEADRELYDPATVRRELAEIEAEKNAEAIPADQAQQAQQAVVNRLLRRPST
jgi:hypothetical protein